MVQIVGVGVGELVGLGVNVGVMVGDGKLCGVEQLVRRINVNNIITLCRVLAI